VYKGSGLRGYGQLMSEDSRYGRQWYRSGKAPLRDSLSRFSG
jgi:hypothetical protein